MPITFAEASRRLDRAAGTIPNATRRAVGAGALAAVTTIRRQPGFTRFLRGVGIKGAKVNVRYDVKGGRNAVALVRALGPFHLIERDTKPHEIRPKQRRRGVRKRALAFKGVVRTSVTHPGTQGKHPFERGKELSLPQVRAAIKTEMARDFRRALKGSG